MVRQGYYEQSLNLSELLKSRVYLKRNEDQKTVVTEKKKNTLSSVNALTLLFFF